MVAPHSYTREDVVEINGHGGAGPLNAILELVLREGARLAQPGEFTLRAFLNGRIDLVQAEAVIDRIRARTKAALKAASAAAHGDLSNRIHAMRDTLAAALARIEAAIDFPEEDLPELVDAALRATIEGVRGEMAALLATAERGRLLREGAAVAIAGRPNVGKSSLFNALLRENRAIVTGAPGTTRDRLEETITVHGVPVRLVDTAGLRETDDEAEQMGVSIARDAVAAADIVLLVLDASTAPTDEENVLAGELAATDTPMVLVLNKIDLAPGAQPPSWEIKFAGVCPISARSGDGLPALEEQLARLLLGGNLALPEQAMLTRVHQRDSLRRAMDAVDRLLAGYGSSPEILSIEMRDALQALGEITGETTPDELLGAIFGSFCIGK
jgi:tRNA modification GTPase